MNYYDAAAVGRRIHQLRKEHQDTQATLAEKLSVSIDTVKRMEAGTSAGITILWILAGEYGITMDDLISGEQEHLCLDDLLRDCSEQERALIWNTVLQTAMELKKNLKQMRA